MMHGMVGSLMWMVEVCGMDHWADGRAQLQLCGLSRMLFGYQTN